MKDIRKQKPLWTVCIEMVLHRTCISDRGFTLPTLCHNIRESNSYI